MLPLKGSVGWIAAIAWNAGSTKHGYSCKIAWEHTPLRAFQTPYFRWEYWTPLLIIYVLSLLAVSLFITPYVLFLSLFTDYWNTYSSITLIQNNTSESILKHDAENCRCFHSPPLSESLVLQQVHTGSRCSKSQGKAIITPSPRTRIWDGQPDKQRGPGTYGILNKGVKMLLKDKTTKYLSNNIQDCCLPTNVTEV